MTTGDDQSLGEGATFAKHTQRQPAVERSLGDARTLGGDSATGIDTAIRDIEVVDLDARYNLEGTLGQGGMGAVVLATDTRLGRKVAIKRILGEAAGSPIAVHRFLTEAKSIAALNHPNVVQIYDYGRAKDGPFLIMEYVDGGSLLDRCKEGALPLADALELACQICDGLAKAHDAGIVHRDIKPANVLLTREGHPKLTDFGLAKAEAGDQGQTMTGAVLGTPDFMPPEQRRDAAEVDHRSDLWSLAATIYQMATGRSPKIIRFNDIPASLQEVLAKALEDQKDARFQSARELRDALKAVTGGIGVVPKPSGPATVIGDELQEGQCKACGTITSDLTKKFCRNPKCGTSLRLACLKCDTQIPVWDGVCGECGGNQPVLVEARRQTLAARRAKAEELVTAFAFDEAIASVDDMVAESRPEFAAFKAWAKEFIESTTKERDRCRAAASRSLDEAQRHATAYDYPAAIHAIERIPERLRDATVGSLLEQCRTRHEEAERLIAEIAGRIKRKELSGLLPLVEQAAVLRGDRIDLLKILGQLRERRDGCVLRATEALASGDAKRAWAAFGGMSVNEFEANGRRLFERVQQLCELEARLANAVAAAKCDGVVTPEEAIHILGLCQEYLAVNPKNSNVRGLEARCRSIAEPLLRKRIQERQQKERKQQEREREREREQERERERKRREQQILAVAPLTNSIGMKLKRLPMKTWTIGQQRGGSDEMLHEDLLSPPYYLGVYEVTNAQWRKVMGSTPSKWDHADRPVERVSWEEAMQFCRKLSTLSEEQNAGRTYRLPTNAEWGYACSADRSFVVPTKDLSAFAWLASNSGNQTHSVGQKKPNSWGLYDMEGNVSEWCSDGRGNEKNYCGGNWMIHAEHARMSFSRCPMERNDWLGFRVAMSMP